MKYGYMRVSTIDKQEFTRQEFLLKDYDLDKIFEEKISGTKKACGREEFSKLLDCIQKGDEIYFESMSRMARSMQDLIDTTNYIVKEKKATVIFLKENLTIGGSEKGLDAMGALIFNIMGAFAQFERDLTADRTKIALKALKEKGVRLGRPDSIPEETKIKIKEYLDNGNSIRKTAFEFNVSCGTVQKIKKNEIK